MRFAALAFVACIAFAAFAGSPVSVAGEGHNLSAVNGSVDAESGQTYGTLSAVNGSVHVGRGATADEAKTVNGEIVVENDAKLGRVKTVNGSLEIADGAAVTGSASTVNGGIEIGKRVQVGGDVSSVSGEIELRGTEVGGKVITSNGDIDLSDGAHVRGGIVIEKNNGHDWGWGNDKQRPNKVRICSTCVVDGELRFERPVELRVDKGAKIGKVVGDSVTRL